MRSALLISNAVNDNRCAENEKYPHYFLSAALQKILRNRSSDPDRPVPDFGQFFLPLPKAPDEQIDA